MTGGPCPDGDSCPDVRGYGSVHGNPSKQKGYGVVREAFPSPAVLRVEAFDFEVVGTFAVARDRPRGLRYRARVKLSDVARSPIDAARAYAREMLLAVEGARAALRRAEEGHALALALVDEVAEGKEPSSRNDRQIEPGGRPEGGRQDEASLIDEGGSR